MNKVFKRIIISAAAAALTVAASATLNVFAAWKQIGMLGDLNNDGVVNVADAVVLTKHLLSEAPLSSDNGYDVKGKYVGISGGSEGYIAQKFLDTADIDQNGVVDIYDFVIMRQQIISGNFTPVYEWLDEPETTTATTATTTVETTTTTTTAEFISAPVRDLYGSLPSQGDAKMLVFYVDFPDCGYDYLPDCDEIKKIAFGEENETNSNYPFESMSAFYSRSSKGVMKLDGEVYRYTAKKNKANYEGDVWHIDLINEIIAEMDNVVDFSKFDGNGDKVVDAILINVPQAAGEDNWWPAAGQFGGDSYNRADGMDIGHVIVGNAEIVSADDYKNFNSSYLHEMGHCMGLPDYYLYGVEDFQGMHGAAGFEMMDDAICDFGAASKLMLGWYTPEQVQVFDENDFSKTFKLNSSVSDNSNCVIIPNGKLDKNYYSEFFIIEFAELKGNNTALKDEWWRAVGEGVRIYHVSAEVTGDEFYNTFKYSSGNDNETDNNNGRRFIRLVGEGTDNSQNFYTSGRIDNSTAEFNWYDDNGKMTIDPYILVDVKFTEGEGYGVTVSLKPRNVFT